MTVPHELLVAPGGFLRTRFQKPARGRVLKRLGSLASPLEDGGRVMAAMELPLSLCQAFFSGAHLGLRGLHWQVKDAGSEAEALPSVLPLEEAATPGSEQCPLG